MKKSVVKKLCALLLILLMVASFAACGKSSNESNNSPANTSSSGGSSPEVSSNTGGSTGGNTSDSTGGNSGGDIATGTGTPAAGKDTIIIAATMDKGIFDPCATNDLPELYPAISQMIYEPLWRFNSAGDIMYVLATGYDWIDPMTMHVHIREGVNFTDGQMLDAYDVLFSLVRFKHREGQPDAFAQLSEELSSVIDDYTVELVFTEINTNIPYAIPGYPILKNNVPSDIVATSPNGTGPYIISDYVINSILVLTQKDNYWRELPKTKNFEFVQLKEDAQRVNALQTGEVDMAAVPFQDVEYVSSLPDIDVQLNGSAFAQGLFFSISPNSPNGGVFYENPDARRAVCYAINRRAIAKLVYYDYCKVSVIPGADFNIFDIDERFYKEGPYADDGYNPELAKQLAVSSGLVDKEVLLINNGASPVVLMCELIQADLKAIGVTCNVNSFDMGSWTQNLFDETKYNMCIDGIVGGNNSISGALRWGSIMGGGSYRNYQWPGHDRYYEITNMIFSVTDPAERLALNYEMYGYCMENLLWFSIIDQVNALAINSGLRGDPKNSGGQNSFYFNLYWG